MPAVCGHGLGLIDVHPGSAGHPCPSTPFAVSRGTP